MSRNTSSPSTSWILRLAAVCWERKKLSLIVLLSSVATIVLAALAPLLTRQAVNDALAGSPTKLPWFASGLLLIGLFDFIGNYMRRGYAGELSLWVQHTLRERVFDSIHKLDGAGQDELRTGQVISRTNSDLQQMHTLLQMCPVPLAIFTYYVVGLAVMLWMSPPMTLIVIAVLISLAVTGLKARRSVFAQSGMATDRLAHLTEHMREVLNLISIVKSCSAELREVKWLDRQSRHMIRVRIGAAVAQAMPGATMLALPVLGQILLLCFGGWSVMNGRIDLGTFIAFASFLAMLTGPTRVLASFLIIAQRTRASVERVFTLIDTRSQIQDGTQSINGHVMGLTLENVSFNYGNGARVLNNVSFSINTGETLAVVGASGSGKSTLLMLLARFYDPSAGNLWLHTEAGHQNIRTLRLNELRRAVGVVFEDAFLFAGTIAENIAYGHPGATKEDIQRAADAAGASRFISALPQGFKTRLSERGTNLSGGQRQRITLARALLTAPDLLILDDTTSAVDAGTEAEINTALSQYADQQRMLLVIARRRSTLQLASKIVVMEKGQVIDIGTQAELEARCPAFRALVAGDRDLLRAPEDVSATLWPEHIASAHDAEDDSLVESRGLARRMSHIAENAVCMALSGKGQRVQALLAPVAWIFAAAAALIAIDSAAHVGVLILLQRGIDTGVVAGNLSTVGFCALLALGLMIISWCCYSAQTVVATLGAETVQHTVRLRSFGHLLQLNLPYHEQNVDSRLTRMTVDVDSLAKFLQNGLASSVTSFITMLAIAVTMFWLDPILALVALSALPVVILATWIYRRLSSPAYAQARIEIGKVNSALQEKVSGIRVVQSLGQQEKESARLSTLSDRFRATRVRAQKYLAVYLPFLTFCTEASYALVLLSGAWRVAEGEMTAGVLAAFLLLLGQFYGPVQQLSAMVDAYQQASASGMHINQLLATPGTENLVASREVIPVRGDLTLRDVSYLYPGSGELALNKLGLTLPQGSVIAIVGPSGAGKSTLIKLIAGLYAPTHGEIYAGTQRVDAMPLADYRSQIGLVEQDVTLFSGDIAENIRYSRPGSTDEEVENAARQVGLLALIRTLRQGFRTPVNNGGADLSAGQRQLIALARAQLADARVLLLDEATSRLDRASEETLMVSLQDSARTLGRTVIVVAHRLTTACRCDAIAVLDKGHIVEFGTHEALLTAGGLYSSLWYDSMGEVLSSRA